jgi:hypothetical protein
MATSELGGATVTSFVTRSAQSFSRSAAWPGVVSLKWMTLASSTGPVFEPVTLQNAPCPSMNKVAL